MDPKRPWRSSEGTNILSAHSISSFLLILAWKMLFPYRAALGAYAIASASLVFCVVLMVHWTIWPVLGGELSGAASKPQNAKTLVIERSLNCSSCGGPVPAISARADSPSPAPWFSAPAWRTLPVRLGEYTFDTSHSVCRTAVPGFAPWESILDRPPLVLADFLISVVKAAIGPEKTSPGRFIELGPRSGDIFGCVSHFAAEGSVAIEPDKSRCAALEGRGLRHLCKDYKQLDTIDSFPAAEIYFLHNGAHAADEIIRHIIGIEQKRPRKGLGVLIIASLVSPQTEAEALQTTFTDRFGGTWHRIFFDEGDRENEFGVRQVAVFDVAKLVSLAETGRAVLGKLTRD